MSLYKFMWFSNFSIILPLLLCLWNFREMCKPKYNPFFCFIIAFCTNEIVSWVLYSYFPKRGDWNLAPYFFLESIILLWMFRRWGLFKENSRVFYILFFLYNIIWSVEFYRSDDPGFLPVFIILYSFCSLIMSFSLMNKSLQSELTPIIYNPVFIINCTFLIFFMYTIIHVVFWLPQLNTDNEFKWKVFTMFNVVNLICNIGYSLAIIQIKKRQQLNYI
jgi:hypothetical protein